MRSSGLSLPFLASAFVLAAACGGSAGDVISGMDSGPPLFPDSPPNCSEGPNYTGCACMPGQQQACYTGPLGTRGVGSCKGGMQTCTTTGESAAYGPCEGEVVPTEADPCNGLPPVRDAGGSDATSPPTDGGSPPPTTDACPGDIVPQCCVLSPTGCTESTAWAQGNPCGWTCAEGELMGGNCPPSCPVDAGGEDASAPGDGGMCGQAAIQAFEADHSACASDSDCTAICMLGASCQTGAVNQAGASAFEMTFAACMFPQCDIACFQAVCTGGACQGGT